MAIGTQDFWPSAGKTESKVVTYVVEFKTNSTSDPAEANFYGGHISDVTRTAAGVFDISFTSKAYMYRVIGAKACALESAVDGADATTVQLWCNCYVDETPAAGAKVQVVTRRTSDFTKIDTTDRRIQVTLEVMTEQPVYSYT